jgi:signal transduction histidine kinase
VLDFLATQSLWLVSIMLVVSVSSIGAAVFFARKAQQSRSTLVHRADDTQQSIADRADLELRLAEQADRMRLIAEVHDAAAVTITGLISQAEGAKFGATSDPQLASRAAAAIADQARSALNDMRRVVNVSRDGASEVEDMPSLTSINDLFEAMNESGIVVKFEESGTAFPIAPSAELAIFRILQEALNNSRTHGGPGTTVKVGMAWSAQGLHVRVDDDGIRAQRRFQSDAAYTIADDKAALVEILSGRGMREIKTRVETFGGVFSAHRVPGVGFSVSAAFPTLRFHNGVHGVNTRGSVSGERAGG